MSSFQLRNIREISGDPLTKFTNELAKKLSKFLTKDQLDKLDDKEDIYSDGQDLETIIRYNELQSQNKFEFNTQYYPIFEPDNDKLTLWLRCHNMGNTTIDWSGFNNVNKLSGDPLLIDGTPFDLGIHTSGVKSTALKFNRPSSDKVNAEGLRVADNIRLAMIGTTIGISYFMRVRLHSLAQEGGSNIRLFEKVDDIGWTTEPINGIMLTLNTSGALTITARRSNVETEKTSDNGTIVVGTIYDIWVTRNHSTGEIKLYVNNVDKTLNNTTNNHGWRHSDDNTDMTLSIMDSGGTTAHGHAYGDLYDFRIYREKIISAAEVGYMWTNKWTITNIPFGSVPVANYFSTYWVVGSSFTSTSFTSASFDL